MPERGVGNRLDGKVWVVSELYYPEGGTGYFLTNIAEDLASPFHVHVLCGQPTYYARGIRAPAHEVRNGVHIRRCFSTTLNKDRMLYRLFNLITLTASVFWNALVHLRRGDIAIVVTNPPTLPFVIYVAAWIHRTVCAVLVYDVYPDVLVAAGIIKQKGLSERIMDWAARWLLARVEKIVVIGRDMESLVHAKCNRPIEDIVVIPNWGDVAAIRPMERGKVDLLKRLGLQEKFVVQYSGNMGRTHGLECLLESAVRLMNVPKIHFLFIGSGAKKEWLEREVSRQGLSNVTILPPQPVDILGTTLNACDLAVISFVPGMAGISVPSRMYNILAAGKPILAAAEADSELALVVLEEKVGWVVPPERPDEIVSHVLSAIDQPDLLDEMSKRARKVAVEKYSHAHVASQYESLIYDMKSGTTV